MKPSNLPSDTNDILRHAPWMASLARHLAGGATGSEDLVQETWLAYLSRPPRDPEAAGSWLRRVLRNFAFRERRSEARRRTREESIARPEAQPSDPDGPEGIVERAELLQHISQHVLQLEEPYRSTVLLRYFEDLAPAEIARRENVPVNTVYTRLRRALEELRARLDADHDGSRAVWLAILAPLAVLPLASSGAAVAATASTHSSVLGKIVIGGIPLASKKIALAVAISTCIFLTVGSIVLWIQSASRHATPGGAGGSAITRPASPLRADQPSQERNSKVAAPEATVASAAGEAPLNSKAPLLKGRVLDARQKGIADAHVVAVPLRAWDGETTADLRGIGRTGDGDLSDELASALLHLRAAAADLPQARSGAAGEFRFDALPDGEHRLLVWRDGFLPSTKTIVLVARPATASCELELQAAQAIRGRIVDDEKRPVAGAAVRSISASWRRLTDQERRAQIITLLGEARFVAESSEVESGPDGRFALPSLEPGLHDIRVEKQSRPSADLFDVPAGAVDVEVVLPRGLTATGVVLGPDKKPVDGAEVTLGPHVESQRPAVAVGEANEAMVSADVLFEKSRVARTTTDGHGRFELPGVARGRFSLAIKARTFPTVTKDVELRDRTDLGVFELEAGGALAGIVVDANGGTVGGARVWIEDVSPEGVSEWGGRYYTPAALVETRTRADGWFRLEGLGDGAYSVHVAATAWVERTVSGVRPGRDDLRIELTDGFTARGRVVDGITGAALMGARTTLKLGLWGLSVPEKSAESGTDGRFELRGLERQTDRRLSVEATHPDYPGEKASAELKHDGAGALVLRMYHLEPLCGRVLDSAGKPVSRARVDCTIAGVDACRSGEDGAFALALPRSTRNYEWFEVSASDEESGKGRVVVERPAEAKPWPDVTLVVGAGSTLRGRVKDASGKPIPRAVVKAWRRSNKEGRGQGAAETAYSSDDGSYTFSHLEDGVYGLEAAAIGYARGVLSDVEVRATARDQDIVLEPGRKIAGRVVDPDGQPVGMAEVVALASVDSDASNDFGTSPMRWHRQYVSAGITSAKSDGAGAYELRDLPASKLTLVARAAGYEPSPLVILEAEVSPDDLVVTPMGSLSGKVEDAGSAQPLSPFTVWVGRKDQEGEVPARELLPREYDDPAGTFRFEALPTGRYVVVAGVEGRPVSGQWIDVRPGEETRARFPVETGVSVAGIVKDADGGASIANVLIRASPIDGWRQQLMLPSYMATTAADGSFRIDGLGTGAYQLYASCADYAPKQKGFQIQAGTEPPSIELTLRRAGRLEGRLAGVGKRKSFWTSLLLHNLDEPGKQDQSFPINAPNGKEDFAFDGVRPGRYEVQLHEEVAGPNIKPDATAFKREDMIERKLYLGEVEIKAGETARFEVTVPVSEGKAVR